MGQRAILLCKIGDGGSEGPPWGRGRLTSLPRLNSLNQEPGFSLGQEVILACGSSREGGEGEKQNDRVTSSASARHAPRPALMRAAEWPSWPEPATPGPWTPGWSTHVQRTSRGGGVTQHPARCPPGPTTSCGGPGSVPLVLQQRGQAVTRRGHTVASPPDFLPGLCRWKALRSEFSLRPQGVCCWECRLPRASTAGSGERAYKTGFPRSSSSGCSLSPGSQTFRPRGPGARQGYSEVAGWGTCPGGRSCSPSRGARSWRRGHGDAVPAGCRLLLA